MTGVLDVLESIADSAGAPPSTLDDLFERHAARKRSRRRRVVSSASFTIVAVGLGALALGGGQKSYENAVGDPTESNGPLPQTLEPEITLPPIDVAAPSTAPSADESELVALIPPPVNVDDVRDPIQRFLGVPSDPAEASDWSLRATAQAVTECMVERGHVYEETVFEPQDLGPELTEKPTFLDDLEGADGCRARANEQTNLLPAANEQFAELNRLISADPRAVLATEALQDCLALNDATQAISIPDECIEVKSVWDEMHVGLMEEYAPRWILEHEATLAGLRDRLHDLVARSLD